MKITHSLHHIFLFSMVFVSFLSVGFIGYLWISHEYLRFNEESLKLREEYLTAQKANIRSEVQRVIDYVHYKRASTEKQIKQQLRSRAYEAASLARSLFDKFQGTKKRQEIEDIIKEALRSIRFNEERGYYFVYDMQGNNILLPFSPELEGKNLWDLQDSNGLYTIRRFIRLVREKGEGFLKWHWYKPGNADHMSEKIGFATYFAPLDWWIGTGEYIEDAEKDVRAECLEWINKIRFGKDGYIFVYTFDAVTLAHYDAENIGKKQWHFTDPTGIRVLQELIRISQEKEGGYLRYIGPLRPSTGKPASKISYTQSVADWEWTIGAGVYVDDIEMIIAKRRNELEAKVSAHVYKISITLLTLLLFISIAARYISKKIKRNFDIFSVFFEKATTESVRIRNSNLYFDEFKRLAHSANRMIDQKNQAQAALRDSERRLSLALESTRQGLWDWDIPTGQIVCDKRFAEVFGYDPAETDMHLSTLAAWVHPDDRAEVKKTMAAHLKGETDFYSAEYRFRAKSGEWKWIRNQGRIIERDQEGMALRAVGTFIDVTHRKEAARERVKLQEQLERSKKMEALGLLAGGVAHDLNNVLSGIVNYPELMLLDLSDDSPLRRPILAMQKSGYKAAAIVQDLLTLARRGVILREVVNMNTIVLDYLASPECDKLRTYHPNVHIRTRLDPKLLNIMGAPIHLKKTVMNLISNAAEAQPDGGEIIISTENRYMDEPLQGYDTIREGDFVVLRVRDRGTGIAPEDRKRIFEPFYTKKVMGRSGTGLGMAVVWGTVQDHDGYIDVESVKGKGTIFELCFHVTREADVPKKAATPIEYYNGNGEVILVVDDVPEQRELARCMLEKLKYTVQTVSSGEKAVEYLKQHTADLILLDMIMAPGIDGLETYRRLIEICPGQKAIIASGFAETERVKAVQALGAGQYLRKPYTIEKLGMAIKAELKRQCLSRKNGVH